MTVDQWFRAGCAATAVFMAAMVFIGAETAAHTPLVAPPFDKIVHFVYYGLMAGLMAHGVGRTWLWVPLIVVPLVGALDEWHQVSIPGRDASIWDWLADEGGTVVAAAVYWWVTARNSRAARAEY